jgi:hypothetical protein
MRLGISDSAGFDMTGGLCTTAGAAAGIMGAAGAADAAGAAPGTSGGAPGTVCRGAFGAASGSVRRSGGLTTCTGGRSGDPPILGIGGRPGAVIAAGPLSLAGMLGAAGMFGNTEMLGTAGRAAAGSAGWDSISVSSATGGAT